MIRNRCIRGLTFGAVAVSAVLGTAACASSNTANNAGNTPSAQSTVTGADTGTASASPQSASASAVAPTTSTSAAHLAATTLPPGPAQPSACRQADMTVATWKGVPGSSGAGHVEADIAFQNTSSHDCTVTGFPRVTLYDAAQHILPTTVTNSEPALASPLTVAPGAWIHSELRYSPDIPGPGESQTGPCEPLASYALVRLPGDTAFAHVPLDVPTTVCEQGALVARPFLDGPASPAGG